MIDVKHPRCECGWQLHQHYSGHWLCDRCGDMYHRDYLAKREAESTSKPRKDER